MKSEHARAKRLTLTPSTLGIFFGVFLLVLSGAAGFYIPDGSVGSTPAPASGIPASSIETPTPKPHEATSPRGNGVAMLTTLTATPAATPPAITTGAATATSGVAVSPVTSPTAAPSPAPQPSPTPTPSPADTPAPESYVVHTVQEGDTIYDIAERYGVEAESIIRYNGLASPDDLQIGDRITIPVSSAPASSEAPASEQYVVHTVEEGDTLSEIADRYGVTVDSIVRYNGLSSADDLTIGDEITIPLR